MSPPSDLRLTAGSQRSRFALPLPPAARATGPAAAAFAVSNTEDSAARRQLEISCAAGKILCISSVHNVRDPHAYQPEVVGHEQEYRRLMTLILYRRIGESEDVARA